MFAGRCYLCGDPTKGLYCHAHEWAEGTENEHETITYFDSREAPNLTRESTPNGLALAIPEGPFHAYWMELFSPDQVIHLAAELGPVAA